MILGGPNVPHVLGEGLYVSEAPALPSGYQIRCIFCGCSVGAGHKPGSIECQNDKAEREISIRR